MKTLQASPQSIKSILSRYEFIIPEFQRPYSWEVDQCNQLCDDLFTFLDRLVSQGDSANTEQYFLGSIVVYPKEKDPEIWMVVDGQQRITTLLILIRLLFEGAGTHTALRKLYCKTDSETDEVISGEYRLESLVLAGDGRDDRRDFQRVMNLEQSGWVDKHNPYYQNMEAMKNQLNGWWGEKTEVQRKKALEFFRNKVMMLPIVCDSVGDALTLFQIINDRGMRLTDADIFKATIYQKMASDKERKDFIRRWNKLSDHLTLFRIHMHIIRAREGEIDKEVGLRPFIQKYFDGLDAQKPDLESIVRCLESYHAINEQETTCSGEDFMHDESIYRAILEKYTNVYCGYPMYVFLHKYGQLEGDQFVLSSKQDEYIALLQDTVRYFYAKGIVYNAVNTIKDTTFKVCAAISAGKNYIDIYKDNLKSDKNAFEIKLSRNDFGRYHQGILRLCASLNGKQNRAEYAATIRSCQLEHILPRSWAHYDRWNSESHEEAIDKIGNHVPLEWKLNIKASDEFFKRKQERYKDSKIQDALDLSSKQPHSWLPADVESRQKVSVDRLRKFFASIF